MTYSSTPVTIRFVIFCDGSNITFIEGDASAYDHSIRKPALNFQYTLLRALGVDEYVIQLLERNASAVLCLSGGNFRGKMLIGRQAERNTGGVDTTIGNSLLMAHAWLFVLISRGWFDLHDGMFDGFAKLGLQMKISFRSGLRSELFRSFFPGTFLKGTWYETEHMGACWGPLLSRMIKISKVRSDPRVVFKRVAKEKLSFPEAIRRGFAAQCLGLRPFCLIPPMRDFVENGITLAPWVKPLKADLMYMVTTSGILSSTEFTKSWYAQLLDRYKFTPVLLDDFLHRLSELQPMGGFFHPGWRLLAEADYA